MSDIIVYGRGKTGQSLCKMIKKLGLSAICFDDVSGFEGIGRFEPDSTVVLSPGVRPDALGRQKARSVGARTVSELDFCFPYCRSRCVSVTGTNGKTTTCELIFHILQDADEAVELLGNGGVPFSEKVLDLKENQTVILESSSFQLDDAQVFSPYISVVTNIAPDHLDYHGNFKNYFNAKCNNFLHQKPNAFGVFNADDEGAMRASESCSAYTFYYSLKNPNANCYFDDGTVQLNVGGNMVNYRCDRLALLAKHNLSNALCAILVCYLLGVDVVSAVRSILSYKYLPHRLQQIATFSGVTFVDDSKATNVHATVSAIQNYNNIPLALISGGSDKGCAFDEIFTSMQNNVKLVCAVGQTAEKIVSCGKKYGVDVVCCADYKQAVRLCYCAVKDSGGVVLMSNACASFDMFSGYDKRGEYFVKVVEELCRDEKKV